MRSEKEIKERMEEVNRNMQCGYHAMPTIHNLQIECDALRWVLDGREEEGVPMGMGLVIRCGNEAVRLADVGCACGSRAITVYLTAGEFAELRAGMNKANVAANSNHDVPKMEDVERTCALLQEMEARRLEIQKLEEMLRQPFSIYVNPNDGSTAVPPRSFVGLGCEQTMASNFREGLNHRIETMVREIDIREQELKGIL